MIDICAVGEILIDLTQSGLTEQGIPRFDANPGGAPANLAVAASRLGAKTAFVGRIGSDGFGDYLRRVLRDNGVDASGLSVDPALRTTLAVVSLDERGERSFSFYRDPSADVNLSAAELPAELLRSCRVLHFGSVSLTAEPARSATLEAVRQAKEAGALISYDPNYRASLWPDETAAVEQMLAPLPLVDILKVSDEELPLLTGTDDPLRGSSLLAERGIGLVFVTLGADGAFFRAGALTGRVPGVPVKVGDTNGAGDTFLGAALSRLVRLEDPLSAGAEALQDILGYANRAAALTASRRGAIPAMPTQEELLRFSEGEGTVGSC
ncbi:MAG: carbohydrate kinase [Oscillospiraceae bacterium]|nr:carbohydrate kinase [Oscillospiraceae bacterium]